MNTDKVPHKPEQATAYIEVEQAAAYIRQQAQSYHPRLSLILGSGLGGLAEEVEQPIYIPYQDIPNFPRASVEGHAGRLVIGTCQNYPVLVMQGRVHFYEGQTMQDITFPIRVMSRLGIETLMITNAAGGLNSDFKVGDLMLISDHINLTGLTGQNPLIGPNLAEFGPRFPSMVTPYDLPLQDVARQAARKTELPLREGVYVNVSGPSFETPAEVRFLRLIGGDAVGMSTAPEVVVARHCGIRVLGISGITNVAVTEPTSKVNTTHEEVLQGGLVIAPRLVALSQEILRILINNQ